MCIVHHWGLAMTHMIEVEIERNYAAFLDIREELMRENEGRYALLRHRKLEGVFDSAGEAARTGYSRFADTDYSIQLITDEPVDLGFYSHALPSG
jgi:hypothetical protein